MLKALIRRWLIRLQRIDNFFIVPCYYIICFGCLMGFNMLFYIIFGTNLLIGGPVPVSVFLPISVFRRKGIPNGIQTEWNLHDDLSWTARKPEDLKMNSERQRRGHEAGGSAPTLVGPSWLPWPTSFAYIYSYTPKTSESTMKPYFHRRNLLYPRDPILGPFPELLRRGHWSRRRSEERRVGKECRSRWSPYH